METKVETKVHVKWKGDTFRLFLFTPPTCSHLPPTPRMHQLKHTSTSFFHLKVVDVAPQPPAHINRHGDLLALILVGVAALGTARAAAAPPASKQSPAPPRQPPVPLVPVPTPTPASVAAPAPAAPAAAPAPPRPPGDQALVLIATALVIAIIAIVLRKVLRRLDVLEDSA